MGDSRPSLRVLELGASLSALAYVGLVLSLAYWAFATLPAQIVLPIWLCLEMLIFPLLWCVRVFVY
jgi:hypothetical protein